MEDGLIVVVAAGLSDADVAAASMRELGAARLWQLDVGGGRVLVYGALFGPAAAAAAAASLRGDGWPADVRPVGGGHLAAWQSHTRPTVIGERLWVCFPWSEFPRPSVLASGLACGLVVEIDPLGAFGTGSHPSTRLLLTQLAARLGGGESVLDVGSGSGVLAISAARLGAGRVAAIDISPAALAATTANAVRNSVTVEVDHVEGDFDVVVANIAAPTLVELAPVISARLRPGGWVGLSGISPAQVSVVSAAFRPLEVVEVPTEDDWAAVVLRLR